MPTNADYIAEILNFAPGACLVLEDDVIRGANAEAIELSGIPRGKFVGVGLTELVVAEHQAALSSALVGADDQSGSVQVRLAAGLIPLELTLRRVSDTTTVVGLRSMENEHQLSALAGGDMTHDQVTGLPNRLHLLEQLHHRLSTPSPQPLAVIALWIDELPDLAREQGERVVERVTRQVGERVQARLRGPDLLGRFDDAAFLALLTTDSPVAQLKLIAERLRDEIVFPVEFDGKLISFTSIVMVGMISGPVRPSIEKVQSRLDVMSRMAGSGQGNRTEIVRF